MTRSHPTPSHQPHRADSVVQGLIRVGARAHGRLRGLHRDEGGAITLLSLFTILGFAMLLGMVINVGQSVDSKVRRQNAADAATYSSTVMLARGMNCVAFSNHLLSEVFALTAYLREGRDRNAEQLVPPILAAWEQMAPVFARSQFPKFARVGGVLPTRIRQEREAVEAFGELSALKARMMLPVFEYILGIPEYKDGQPFGADPQQAARTHLIPEFQRAVVRVIPQIASRVALDLARRHLGNGTGTRTTQAALWRSRVARVGSQSEEDPLERTLPAVDPAPEGYDAQTNGAVLSYLSSARDARNSLAHRYLDEWNNDSTFDLGPFYSYGLADGVQSSAMLSQFYYLWRTFTCGQLNRLLGEEYPTTNMPHMMRRYSDGRDAIESDHMFVGTVFSPGGNSFLPGLFDGRRSNNNPQGASPHTLTFTQAFLLLPRPRYTNGPNWLCPRTDRMGGTQGYYHCGDPWPTDWNLFSQNWGVKLVPATVRRLDEILTTSPGAMSVQIRPLGNLSTQEIRRISFH
jgi:hypothetical protein